MSKFEVGDKVQRSAQASKSVLKHPLWKEAEEMNRPYLFVSGITPQGIIVCELDLTMKNKPCVWAYENDLVHYKYKKKAKFEIGQKVVPISKKVGIPFEEYNTYCLKLELKIPYLIISKIDEENNLYHCEIKDIDNDNLFWFRESYLIPYEEKNSFEDLKKYPVAEWKVNVEPKNEKPPVWYKLPNPTKDRIPDYKGFYEFIKKSSMLKDCADCILFDYMDEFSSDPCPAGTTCLQALTEYAEAKFIKGEIKC